MSDARRERAEAAVSEPSSVAAPEQWVDACLAGDRAAMQKLYQHCSGRIYSLMVRMVGRQEADDLTQQVFLQMFRKLGQFCGRSRLETWLYRLATNEALQHLRRRKRYATTSLISEPATDDTHRTEPTEQTRLLETAIIRLEPQLRAVFLLKEQQGLSYREIAESVGIPEGTVGSRLNRARRMLRNELTKLGWD